MTEAIPTLQHKTSKLETGTSYTAHKADHTHDAKRKRSIKTPGTLSL